MKPNLTEIIFLLDNSSSMESMGNEPIAGYNEFIKEQSDPSLGEAKVTLVTFGSYIKTLYSGVDIRDVKPLTENEYIANGMTALRDAIGSTADAVGKRLSNTPEDERPSKVLFCILTDGEENYSRKYSVEDIKRIIDTQTNVYNWKFDFMGCTRASVENAKSYNIPQSNINFYDNTPRGLVTAYSCQSLRSKSYRTHVDNL